MRTAYFAFSERPLTVTAPQRSSLCTAERVSSVCSAAKASSLPPFFCAAITIFPPFRQPASVSPQRISSETNSLPKSRSSAFSQAFSAHSPLFFSGIYPFIRSESEFICFPPVLRRVRHPLLRRCPPRNPRFFRRPFFRASAFFRPMRQNTLCRSL